MREDVLSLRAMGGDPVSEEYLKAELYYRAEALKDIPDAPLFFGRLDYAGQHGADLLAETEDGIAGHSFHIGRRHVHAPDGTPAVIDWRAPVSRPFYRASAADPMDLALRRRFGFSGGELTAYEDERFAEQAASGAGAGDPARSAPRPAAGPSQILIDEIERPRSGPMRDIVATIQPDQDDIVRAGADQTVCVQGAPGTGKTAVGLHRVAYLLYAYREQVRRRGVVMVGPNRAFLSYIRNVLPALGELDVRQTTVGELVSSVPARGTDDEAAALVFGLLSSAAALAEAAQGVLTATEQAAIVWPAAPRGPGSARWSAADVVLIDEARDLITRTPSLAHVVVDEAQDLSPMECRALGRRCSTGAATVLGDLAQGTTPWAAPSWESLLANLGKPETGVRELSVGYRVPRQILDYASTLLAVIAPELKPASSLRADPGALDLTRVPA